MQHPDHAVHALHERRRADGPSAPQQLIVNILHAHTGELAENVHLVEQFLEIHHFHLPRALLMLDDFTQRVRGAAMPPAGIEEHQLECFHSYRFLLVDSDRTIKSDYDPADYSRRPPADASAEPVAGSVLDPPLDGPCFTRRRRLALERGRTDPASLRRIQPLRRS